MLPDTPFNANLTSLRYQHCSMILKDPFEIEVSFSLESPIFTPFLSIITNLVLFCKLSDCNSVS